MHSSSKEPPVRVILFIKCLHLSHAPFKQEFSLPKDHSAFPWPPFALKSEKLCLFHSPSLKCLRSETTAYKMQCNRSLAKSNVK